MNEQLLAVIIAAIIGFLSNIIIKKMEKSKPEEEKNKLILESAKINTDIMQDVINTLSERNKQLEYENKKLKDDFDACSSLIFSIINDINVPLEIREHIKLFIEKEDGN